MAKQFPPILLPAILDNLPHRYAHKLKQFSGEKGYSAEEHLWWLKDWIDIEEVDHEDIRVRLFSQILG